MHLATAQSNCNRSPRQTAQTEKPPTSSMDRSTLNTQTHNADLAYTTYAIKLAKIEKYKYLSLGFCYIR